MAKVTNPLFATEARGKVAGLVYNTWRGVRYVKGRTAPAQPRTTRQLLIRSYLTQLSRLWAAVIQANKDSWNTWAQDHPVIDWTGNSIRMTGHNAYCCLNTRMLDMGKTIVPTAPVAVAPTPIAGVVLTAGAGQISIAFTAHGGTADTLDIWGWGPHSAGRVPKIQRARHKAYVPAETTPYVLTGLAPGLWTLWLRCISETDGQASTWVEASATVT